MGGKVAAINGGGRGEGRRIKEEGEDKLRK